MKYKFVLLLVTCASRKEADRIVDELLAARLIACANIIPGIESRFRWKGKIDSAREILIVLKTKELNFSSIEKMVKKLHS